MSFDPNDAASQEQTVVAMNQVALAETWDYLKIQLSPFCNVLVINEGLFASWDDVSRNFIANMMR
jgi:hypothetical protein